MMVREGTITVFDGEQTQQISSTQLDSMLADATLTIFRLGNHKPSTLIALDDQPVRVGGATRKKAVTKPKAVRKKPAAAMVQKKKETNSASEQKVKAVTDNKPVTFVYTTPLTTCTSCNTGSLTNHCLMDVLMYDVTGRQDVRVQTKQCSKISCRMNYAPNFKNIGNDKVNTCSARSLADNDVLFISVKRGFTVRLIRYHVNLMFRGFLSSKAVA
jgi:hypothetical protein